MTAPSGTRKLVEKELLSPTLLKTSRAFTQRLSQPVDALQLRLHSRVDEWDDGGGVEVACGKQGDLPGPPSGAVGARTFRSARRGFATRAWSIEMALPKGAIRIIDSL